jgi:hypothetical protein
MKHSNKSIWLVAALGLFATACPQEGVGDPCTPEDEYRPEFNGYGLNEVNVESRSFQCVTRICLVNHFQGRVSCPYGQDETALTGTGARCATPGTNDLVTVVVKPQMTERRPSEAVYCSCRCAGPDKDAIYCECPDGYSCAKLVPDVGLGRGQLAGSYCIKKGTAFDDNALYGTECVAVPGAADEDQPCPIDE